MQSPRNGTANQSESNNRYSHCSIMAAQRLVGRIIGGLICCQRLARNGVISNPTIVGRQKPAQSGTPDIMCHTRMD
jgi:hypothetical protein